MSEAAEARALENRMRGLDDKELQQLVAVRHHLYRPEALEAARAELRQRNLAIPDAEGFWQLYPGERIRPDGFCQDCADETTDEPLEDVISLGWYGIRILGGSQHCPACGSTVQSKWFCFPVPVWRLGRYRTIVLGDGLPPVERIGRKLKPS